MLVQDTLTGYFHEVPDSQVYGPQYAEYPEPMGEVVYDGLGNPVGLSFLAPLAAKILPAIASRVLPAAAKALPGIVRGVTGALQRFNPVAQAAQRVLPGLIRQFTPAVQAFQQAVPAALQQFAPAAQAFQQALPGAVQQLAPVAQAAQQFFPPDAGAENEFAEVPIPIMQPPFRPFMAMPKPSPSAPSRFDAGTRTSSNMTCRVGCAFQPIFFSSAPKARPGVPFSATRVEMPEAPPSAVRAIVT